MFQIGTFQQFLLVKKKSKWVVEGWRDVWGGRKFGRMHTNTYKQMLSCSHGCHSTKMAERGHIYFPFTEREKKKFK